MKTVQEANKENIKYTERKSRRKKEGLMIYVYNEWRRLQESKKRGREESKEDKQNCKEKG